MPSFKHILFPVDFSDQNCSIAPHIASMASRYGARVTMLHAMELPTAAYPDWPEYVDVKSIVDARKRLLDSLLVSEFQHIPTARVICEGGDPGRHIAEYAESEKVDLIMMPTHGYGPFRRFLLGSVAAKVLHDVECPVWTSAHVPKAPAPHVTYGSVLCALDYTPQNLSLLRWASLFACEQGARLKLVHAIPAVNVPGGVDPEGGKFRAFLFEMAREEFHKLQQQAGTTFEMIIKGGDVAHVVHEAADENHADLVVIGRGVMHGLFGRMRTNVYSIIREVPCPVISV